MMKVKHVFICKPNSGLNPLESYDCTFAVFIVDKDGEKYGTYEPYWSGVSVFSALRQLVITKHKLIAELKEANKL